MLENWSPIRILFTVLFTWALIFVVAFGIFYWIFIGWSE